jgi:four helix bundle protein
LLERMNHEDTEIYKKSIELCERSFPVASRVAPGFAFLADQIRRSAASVPANFCEGCRKKSAKHRRKYFDDAAGSASEVSAHVDVAFTASSVSDDERKAIKDLCDHICAMLHKFH